MSQKKLKEGFYKNSIGYLNFYYITFNIYLYFLEVVFTIIIINVAKKKEKKLRLCKFFLQITMAIYFCTIR